MLKYIDKNEYYPFYELNDPEQIFPLSQNNREFSDEEIALIESTMEQFKKIQKLIEERLKNNA